MVSRGHPFVPWQANHPTMSLPRRACPLRSPRGRIPLPPPTGMATRLTGAAPRHRRAAGCWHGQPPVFMVPLTSPASWHTPSFSRAVHVYDSRHRSAPFVRYALLHLMLRLLLHRIRTRTCICNYCPRATPPTNEQRPFRPPFESIYHQVAPCPSAPPRLASLRSVCPDSQDHVRSLRCAARSRTGQVV